jgi:hypothetical protein
MMIVNINDCNACWEELPRGHCCLHTHLPTHAHHNDRRALWDIFCKFGRGIPHPNPVGFYLTIE